MTDNIRRCMICKARIINDELVPQIPYEKDKPGDFTDGVLSRKCFIDLAGEFYKESDKFDFEECPHVIDYQI